MDNIIPISCSHLRIAVVAHALRGGGGLSAGHNMIMSLLSIAPWHNYLFLMPDLKEYRSIPLDSTKQQSFFYHRTGGHLGRYLFDTFRLRKIIQEFEPDVILCLANRGITYPPCPQAVLCRDAHLFYPFKHFGRELFWVKFRRLFQRWMLKRELRYTKLLLYQTEVARKRLRDTYGFTGEMALCGNAITPETLASDTSEMPATLAKHQDKMKLFCLARYYPQKNLEALMDLFQRYGNELEGVVVVITIAADQHSNARKLLKKIEHAGLGDRIINVGPLSQKEIVAYYRYCQALFLPTFLESFTRTYLEAMHFGMPILTSDLDFAHEVCGESAIYFDPWNIESIKKAILSIKNDPLMANKLIDSGKMQMQTKFSSWDEIAANLLDKLHEIVEKRQTINLT